MLQGLATVAGLSDHFHVRLRIDQGPETLALDGVVVHECDPDVANFRTHCFPPMRTYVRGRRLTRAALHLASPPRSKRRGHAAVFT